MLKFRIFRVALFQALFCVLSLCGVKWVLAQGQDGTPAERDIMILAELLPGAYNNANQAYFDVRLKVPVEKRHKNLHTEINRINALNFGEYVFLRKVYENSGGEAVQIYLHTLDVDFGIQAVRMKTYILDKVPGKKIRKQDATYLAGCDLLWQREVSQYRGELAVKACLINQQTSAFDMQLSDEGLWVKALGDSLSPYKKDRARPFSCYIDVPGVGGGRDIPYKRYDLGSIHDLGDEGWIKTADGQEIGLSLFRVHWTFNNYDDVFARPSFVIYLKTKTDNGDVIEKGYSFTSPDAQRIGINLKWALAYCYMVSNEDIKPFFKNEPRVH